MIRPGKLFWKLFLGNILLMGAVLAISFWLIFDHWAHSHAEQLSERLYSEALLLRIIFEDKFEGVPAEQVDRLVKDIAASRPDSYRVTLILPDGRVLADSRAEPAKMQNHADRPEVKDALAHGSGKHIHISRTLSTLMEYVAIRVGSADAPVGIIRVAVDEKIFNQQKAVTRGIFWTIAGASILMMAGLALGLALLWTRPIQRITAAARNISKGDLSARVAIGGRDELALLAQSLNRMRNHLALQLQTIDRQRITLQSLIAQLHEGVVVVGADGHVVLINPTALPLLGVSVNEGSRSFEGRAVEDFILKYELQRMLLPGTRKPGETGIQEYRQQIQIDGGEVSVLARASDIVLPRFAREGEASNVSAESTVGRLLVLTDVSALDHMIQMKADFAANASHELRTPLATIRAAVETLMQMDLSKSTESVEHFLRLIDRHSSRMQAMVGDLLDLSRIESSPTHFEPSRIDLKEFLADLHLRYADRLDAKGLQWSSSIRADVTNLAVNTHLLRLVVDNLVENAIKFTEAGGQIRINAWENKENDQRLLHLQVADTGCGIPEEDQDRVFERFYQVERARSGPDRGTGLGLSIVRHAVAAMQGTVELKSKLGEGTSVTVTLPQPVRVS